MAAGSRAGVSRAIGLIARGAALLTTAIGLPLRAIAGLIRVAILGVRHVADLSVRLCASVGTALELTARTVAGAIGAMGLGIVGLVDGIARLRGWLAIRCRSSVRAGARAVAGLGRRAMRPARRLAELRAPRAIPFGPFVRASMVPALVCALYALLPSDGPQQYARAVPSPHPAAETRLEPAALASPPPAEETDRSGAQSPRPAALSPPPVPLVSLPPPPPPSEETDRPGGESSRPAALSPPRARASAPALPAVADAEPPVSAIHVIGRLSARDRSAAERDLSALLAGVGGAERGRRHRVGSTALDVVVPHTRYSEFAHGLTRIGSWRLEAERAPLPDTVHITIHVSE
ncbi:MAG TPA: hypothetical protein VLK35_08185 [Methylomirabilota bacterium]|nr:hypothetical protein [Methylomirabilota bacterium]